MAHVIVEAGYRDAPIGAVQRSDHRSNDFEWIADRTTVASRMHRTARPCDMQVGRDNSTQAVHDSRNIFGHHFRVTDDHAIGAKASDVPVEDKRKRRAPEFFLSFKPHLNSDWKRLGARNPTLNRGKVSKELTLVVTGAATDDSPLLYYWVERWRSPNATRPGRLNVVVSVEEDRRTLRSAPALRENARCTALLTRKDGSLQANSLAVPPQP